MVWPMVPAGTSNDEITIARDLAPAWDRMERHADHHPLSVLVENKPGVLRASPGSFSRRGFNIESSGRGPHRGPAHLRMTIVVSVDLHPEQVTKQLNKLVNVIKIVELEPRTSVQRELIFIKVRADSSNRSDVLEICQMFRARIVDVAPGLPTIESTGTSDKLSALLEMLSGHGVLELAQSGAVALGRGSRSIADRGRKPA